MPHYLEILEIVLRLSVAMWSKAEMRQGEAAQEILKKGKRVTIYDSSVSRAENKS